MSDLEGVMLSDYLLLQCISKGGMADVYYARQNGEGNYEVAVKVYRPGYAQHESFREFFMAEAEKIGQFDHPNILPFLEFGEGEGLLYVVTPFIVSGTLEDLLKRVGGKFSAMQALPIMQQVCSAVQYAHNHHVIHGNIKPTNIFVAADGRMLLADFGIARGYDDSQQSLTRVGWGSAEYAAPEQSLGVLRSSSDIYSLGVLLFRILTGQPPFAGQTPVEVLLKHVRQQTPSARVLVPTISDAVEGVLQMAMQKRSDDRFASAEELSNAFLAAVTVAPVASPVAKPATMSQPVFDQRVSAGNPPAPVPAMNSSTNPGDPQTPVPAHLAFTSFSSSAPFFEESVQQTPSALLGNGGNSSGSGLNATDRGKNTSLEESASITSMGKHGFWSVDPVEWSPMTNAQGNSAPLTADAYLRSKPVATVPSVSPALPALSAASPAAPSNLPIPSSSAKKIEKEGSNRLGALLRKLLPVVVVILLLLGLLGAILSSFFFPSDGSGAYMPPLYHRQSSVMSLESSLKAIY
jgi:serine/threonine protein kinase